VRKRWLLDAAVAAACSASRPPFGARYTRAVTGAFTEAAPRFLPWASQPGVEFGIGFEVGAALAALAPVSAVTRAATATRDTPKTCLRI
jgi:hypothetical protein